MKKLNRKLIKGTNWFLSGIISFLMISSCNDDKFEDDRKSSSDDINQNDDDDDNGGGGTMVEYGTPYAEFIVSGKVTDTDGKGLPEIRIVVPSVTSSLAKRPGVIYDNPVSTISLNDTLYTNNNGDFTFKYNDFPSDTVKVNMKFEDAKSNAFNSDSTTVVFTGSELKDGSGWNSGKAEKNVSIKLNKK